MLKKIACAACFSVCLGATSVHAETNILFILDASNSMWGQIDGTAKIVTAKSVLDEALTGLSPEVLSGLMIYGHRKQNDCSDVELVAPLASGSAARIKAAISAVNPRGKTPIAASLKASAGAFSGREEENNSILLISDGIETCEGDPCAVAAELVQRGINVRVNVVGFDVDAETRAQLQCIADKGNGQYFDAKNASDFQEAVVQAQEIAVAPEPAVKEPSVYFEDQFDGDDLGAEWDLSNPNPDAYLVEGGLLTMIARDGTAPDYANTENILRLNKPIPKGDWTITTRFVLTPQSMGETVRIGIAKDNENSMLSSLWFSSYNYALTNITVRSDKLSGGTPTGFSRNVFNIENRDMEIRSGQFTDKVKAVQLKLEKTGRNYVSSMRFESTDPEADGAVSEEWFAVQKLTSLRAPGDAFTLFFASNSNSYTPGGGEGLVEVDWVKIEIPQ